MLVADEEEQTDIKKEFEQAESRRDKQTTRANGATQSGTPSDGLGAAAPRSGGLQGRNVELRAD